MRRDSAKESDFGQDSFLDVVANIVGVLVILVMLVGVRASQHASSPETATETAEVSVPEKSVRTDDRSKEEIQSQLEKASRHAFFQEKGLRDTTVRLVKFSQQIDLQERHRFELAKLRADLESDLERRRNELSKESQKQYDVQKQIFDVKLELQELSNQQLALLSAPGTVEEIEVEPTPVARKVEEDSAHIRLIGGSVCRVPFHELKELLDYEMTSIQRELQEHGQVNRVVGPIDGFRLRLKTRKVVRGGAVTGPLVGNLSSRVRYVPTGYYLADSTELGEPLDQALLPNSNFRAILKEARKQSSVVVAWIYNDSFDDYRTLRKLLSEFDFSIAVYNLPLGMPIQASPDGRDPWAQ